MNLRILLNLTGIEEIDDIGLEADTLMKEIDDDGNGQIDRVEWRDKWLSMQKALGNSDLRLNNNMRDKIFTCLQPSSNQMRTSS